MLGTLLWLAGVAALGWLALVALLVLQERRLLFFPARALAAAPADYGLAAEELALRTADGVMLHGWWIEGPGDRVLIWYHGNAGNIGDRLHNARWFVDRLGVSVVLVDYRGYGRSGGSPDEAGVYADGLAVYDAVAARAVRPERIVLFGRSLGGAVALEVALHRRAGAIALESVFRSVRALAREHYPFVPGSLVRTRMDNVSKIARVGAPVLVLHGDRDSIVPLAPRAGAGRARSRPGPPARHRGGWAQRHLPGRGRALCRGVARVPAGDDSRRHRRRHRRWGRRRGRRGARAGRGAGRPEGRSRLSRRRARRKSASAVTGVDYAQESPRRTRKRAGPGRRRTQGGTDATGGEHANASGSFTPRVAGRRPRRIRLRRRRGRPAPAPRAGPARVRAGHRRDAAGSLRRPTG